MPDYRLLKPATTRALLAFAVLSVFFVEPTFAARRYAVVVAVSEFDAKPSAALPYVKVDAQTTVETLQNLGFEVYTFCEENVGLTRVGAPTREKILNFLQNELPKKVGTDDVAFIYFSSHGRVLNAQTFLWTKDTEFTDEKDGGKLKPQTAISARELRDAASKLQTKRAFLALDACESGGVREKGYDGSVLDYLRAEDDFEVATLASCATNQKSGAIVLQKDGSNDERTVSHFTYWLNQGLRGYADEDSNGVISTAELARYVQFNSAFACDLRRARDPSAIEQTSIVVASEKCESFDFAEVEPRERFETFDEIAEQVAICLYATAKKNKTRELSVFVDDGAPVKKFDSEPARDAASTFYKSFRENFEANVQTKLKDLDVDVKFVSKSSPNEDVPEFLFNVSSTNDPNERAYQFSGRLIGLKYANGKKAPDYPVDAKIAYSLEDSARLGEVVKNDFSDAVSVWLEVVKTNGTKENRVPEEINGALWVPLDVGEKYSVVYSFAQTPKQKVGVRVLVDGRNTLQQFERYVSPMRIVAFPPLDTDENPKEATEDEQEDILVKRSDQLERSQPLIALDHARFWVASKRGNFCVKGFYRRLENGDAVCAPFEVALNDVSPNESDVSKQNDAIGSILIAFYRLTKQREPGPKDVRTVPSSDRPTSLIRVNGFEIAEGQKPFVCFSIRYASSEALERFRKNPDEFYSEKDYVYY